MWPASKRDWIQQVPHFQSRRDGFSFPACPPYVRDGAEESGERGDGSASVTLDRLAISLYTVTQQVYKEIRRGFLELINNWKPGQRFCLGWMNFFFWANILRVAERKSSWCTHYMIDYRETTWKCISVLNKTYWYGRFENFIFKQIFNQRTNDVSVWRIVGEGGIRQILMMSLSRLNLP